MEVLSLVDECVSYEDVVHPSFTLGEGSLEGVGKVCFLHKMLVNNLPKQLVIEIGL